MTIKTTEAQVLKACLELLRMRHVFAWRNNTGVILNAKGGPCVSGWWVRPTSWGS